MKKMNFNEPGNEQKATWSALNLSQAKTVENPSNSGGTCDENNYFQDFDSDMKSEKQNKNEMDEMEQSKTKLVNKKPTNIVIITKNQRKISLIRKEKNVSKIPEVPMRSLNCTPTEKSVVVIENKVTEQQINSNINVPSENNNQQFQGYVMEIPPVLVRSIMLLCPAKEKDTKVHQEIANVPMLEVNNDQQDVSISLSQISLKNVPYQQNTTIITSTSTPDALMENTDEVLDLSIKKKYTEEDNEVTTIANYVEPPKYDTVICNYIGNYDKRIGLVNQGSLCYLNSVMQALLATNDFSSFAVVKMYRFPYWAKLAELFVNMMFSSFTKIRPKKYYMHFNSKAFDIFQENDASEFLINLMTLLKKNEPHWETLRATPDNEPQPLLTEQLDDEAVAGCSSDIDQTSEETPRKRQKKDEPGRKFFVDNIFKGLLASSIKCQMCKNFTHRRDPTYMLHLSIPRPIDDEVHTIENLLYHNFLTETLSGDNKYMCEKCGYKQTALKYSVFVQVPKYLIILLKNTTYDKTTSKFLKHTTKVQIEEIITLPCHEIVKTGKMYNLYAMIIHRGQFSHTGHYIALIKANNQWLRMDDSVVTPINESDINNLSLYETPYMLFYRRSDIEEGKFPSAFSISWLEEYVRQRNAQGDYF